MMMNAFLPTRALLLAVLSANLIPSDCTAEPSGTFDTLRQRHAEELAKTGEARKAHIRKLNANYLLSLESYESGRRKVNDLDAMIAVRDEKLRLEKHGTVKPSDVVKDPATLGALQMNYVKSESKHASDIARRELPIHRQYISMLEALQREFATAKQVDDANLVKDEIARVRKLIPQDPSKAERVTLPSSLRNGLELHLGFDQLPGFNQRITTTIFDRSGKRNHGKIGGAAKRIANGRVGGAIELGGGSDRVVSPVDTAEQGTVCAWFKPKKTLDSSTPQLEIVASDAGIGFFVVNQARGTEGAEAGDSGNGAIGFSFTTSAGDSSVCSTETKEWRAGTWYFLCCTWDGSERRIYVNGKLEGKRDQAHSHRGANLVVGSSKFEGTVDEVMKWNRTLTESEIAALLGSAGG